MLKLPPRLLLLFTPALNYTIAFLGIGIFVGFFIPFVLNPHISTPLPNNAHLDLYFDSIPLLGSFFVIILPALDILLDTPAALKSFFDRNQSSSKIPGVNRLTDLERFLFIIGCGIQSTVCFLPSETDPLTVEMILIATNLVGKILVLIPILIFLERSTTTFTPFRSFLMVLFGVIGITMNSLFQLYALIQQGEIYKVPRIGSIVSSTFSVAAIVICLCTISICTIKYCHTHLATSMDRKILGGWFLKKVGSNQQVNERAFDLKRKDSYNYKDADDELYTNYVPALHMISLFIFIACNIAKTFRNPNIVDFSSFSAIEWFTLIGRMIVLITELRIRKNEITRGLVRV
jgi:hypothetical protein